MKRGRRNVIIGSARVGEMRINMVSKDMNRPIKNERRCVGSEYANLIPLKDDYIWKLAPDKNYKDEEHLCIAANQNFARLFEVERFPLKRMFGDGKKESKLLKLEDIIDILVKNNLELYEDAAMEAAKALVNGEGFLVGHTIVGDPLYCTFIKGRTNEGVKYQLSIQRGWYEPEYA